MLSVIMLSIVVVIVVASNYEPCGYSEEMIGGAETQIVLPAKKLEDLIRLAELCVDLLRQNEEFYAEVMSLHLSPPFFPFCFCF